MAWRVARSLDVLLAQLNAAFPRRSRASDGSIGDTAHQATTSDHNPDRQDIVRARDFTHDPANGLNIAELGVQLAASRDPRIKYIIANGTILHARAGHLPWSWASYTGANPHTKHLHLSVVADARADDTSPWRLPMLGFTEEDELSAETERLIKEIAPLVRTIHHEATLRLPDRIDYRYLGEPEPKPEARWYDTVVGRASSADARAYEARRTALEVRNEVQALRRDLPGMMADAVRAVIAERPSP